MNANNTQNQIDILPLVAEIKDKINNIKIEVEDFGNQNYWLTVKNGVKIMEVEISSKNGVYAAFQDEHKKILPFSHDEQLDSTNESILNRATKFFKKDN